MNLIRPTFLAAMVAAGCSLLWICLAYSWDFNPTWAAWPVGALIGLAMWLGGQRMISRRNGLVAVGIALAAIATSLHMIELIQVRQMRAEHEHLAQHEEGHLWLIASEIAEEWEAADMNLKWPSGANLGNALYEEDFPAEVWNAAEVRWNALSPEEQRKEVLLQKAMGSALKTQFSAAGGQQRLALRELVAHMSTITMLFIALGLTSAYLTGTGNFTSSETDTDKPETSAG